MVDEPRSPDVFGIEPNFFAGDGRADEDVLSRDLIVGLHCCNEVIDFGGVLYGPVGRHTMFEPKILISSMTSKLGKRDGRMSYLTYKSGSFPACNPSKLSPRICCPYSAISNLHGLVWLKGMPRITIRSEHMRIIKVLTKEPFHIQQRGNVGRNVEHINRIKH